MKDTFNQQPDPNRHDDSSDDIQWQAFLYACDELGEPQRTAFEQLLAEDQRAQQALVQAVESIEISARLDQVTRVTLKTQLKSGAPLLQLGEPQSQAPDFVSSISHESFAVGTRNGTNKTKTSANSTTAKNVALNSRANIRWHASQIAVVACLFVLVAGTLVYLSGMFDDRLDDVANTNGDKTKVAEHEKTDGKAGVDRGNKTDINYNDADENEDDQLEPNDLLSDQMLDELANVWMGSDVVDESDAEFADLVLDEINQRQDSAEPVLFEADEMNWIDRAWIDGALNELNFEQEEENDGNEIMM